jgi:tryptophan halogenase
MKKIVILGGGTAGWITALYMNKLLPNCDITVVADSKTGIIGVGEATTPQILGFLEFVGINLADAMVESNATIKSGISFENWRGDGEKYFHGFNEKIFDIDLYVPNIYNNALEQYINQCIKEKKSLNEYLYQTKLSYKNKIDLGQTATALHFDTKLFGNFLKRHARLRGVNFIDGLYVDANLDADGNITKLILESGEVDGDFFFDCSGFSRLLIGKLFGTKWKSYKKHLPMKAAIPYWTDQDEQIQPYTTATAMKYGWNWKIPLTHRNGCGYVFDSDYISPEEAQKEVEEWLGHPITVNKVIKFDAGNFEKSWVNNCIAVGIASTFIEPLESTSIFLTIMSLQTLKHFLNEMYIPSKRGIDQYNEIINNGNNHIMQFVYLHYMTDRNDTPFWRDFKEKNEIPEGFVENLWDPLTSGTLRDYDVYNKKCSATFHHIGYLQVGNGLGLIKSVNNKFYDVSLSPQEYKEHFDKLIDDMPYHHEWLRNLSKK